MSNSEQTALSSCELSCAEGQCCPHMEEFSTLITQEHTHYAFLLSCDVMPANDGSIKTYIYHDHLKELKWNILHFDISFKWLQNNLLSDCYWWNNNNVLKKIKRRHFLIAIWLIILTVFYYSCEYFQISLNWWAKAWNSKRVCSRRLFPLMYSLTPTKHKRELEFYT